MKKLIFALLFTVGASSAFAEVSITDAWARATVPGQPVGAIYMKISSSTATRMVSAETDAAKQVQVHDMHMHDGVMRMREHGQLDVTPGQTVELAPGGKHLMLMGLTKPLVAGESVTVKMTFEDAKNKKSTSIVTVPIRALRK
ncbi:copper chaperone PCu(A)C [Noviherbaspirillum saxi]|uniref:Copper chaperone PCu(A)C n=1 Tax=Noviherbaspirillum saxi TaxID=2320863 RepID=A0A3A3FF75_9BURK|nr:copper chaperone PCu(A)C [Noviherbaspirillum saxi]RJF91996.1 copper chaperone PCu(A)C [Noviherbaspirillum saxi]